LRHTQQKLVDTKQKLQIKLKIFITEDFVMEIILHTSGFEYWNPCACLPNQEHQREGGGWLWDEVDGASSSITDLFRLGIFLYLSS
jgi:hypothetical protein